MEVDGGGVKLAGAGAIFPARATRGKGKNLPSEPAPAHTQSMAVDGMTWRDMHDDAFVYASSLSPPIINRQKRTARRITRCDAMRGL